MSWQTTCTFKFKIEVQIPSTYPSTACSHVLGIHNNYSPLINFDLEFIMHTKLGKHL